MEGKIKSSIPGNLIINKTHCKIHGESVFTIFDDGIGTFLYTQKKKRFYTVLWNLIFGVLYLTHGGAIMLTELGRELRKLRIDKKENLAKMSKKLGVSVSYLSAIENGARDVPHDFVGRLSESYNLPQDQIDALNIAAANSASKVSIPLCEAMAEQRQLAFMLSRKLNNLTSEECDQIMTLLKGKGD